MSNNNRLIFHIDVNSAYLSWSALYLLDNGYKVDLRNTSSVIGGNEESRHGIVLAKSIPAKKYKINTGETLFSARMKCKDLVVVPPDYNLFMRCSNSMVKLLETYTPHIQRFSCDECFLDFTKPDRVHTLYPHEIEKKMWVLPVGDLFGVGRKTLKKLNDINIKTIGDLAKFDKYTLKYKLKSYGEQIWLYANGIENSEVKKCNHPMMKGMGNSTTTHFDMTTREEAHMIITSLCETLAMRLRKNNSCCDVLSIHYKTDSFFSRRKQRKLLYCTSSTQDIKREALRLFDELWEHKHIRQVGVQATGLSSSNEMQLSLFEEGNIETKTNLDKVLDNIREKYGKESIHTAQFISSPITPFSGGIPKDDYPLMSSLL